MRNIFLLENIFIRFFAFKQIIDASINMNYLLNKESCLSSAIVGEGEARGSGGAKVLG